MLHFISIFTTKNLHTFGTVNGWNLWTNLPLNKFGLLFPTIVLDLFWVQQYPNPDLTSSPFLGALAAISSRLCLLYFKTNLSVRNTTKPYLTIRFSSSYDPHPRPKNIFLVKNACLCSFVDKIGLSNGVFSCRVHAIVGCFLEVRVAVGCDFCFSESESLKFPYVWVLPQRLPWRFL